jgi:transcription elongation factor GreA
MQIRLTSAAIKKIQDELAFLESRERPRVAERIKQARGYGDLSENYEYHAAKEEQGFLEARIRELRAVLSRAQVVDADSLADGVVGLGTRVRVRHREFDEEEEYTIVTMVDADPGRNRISEQSPIGKALMGARVGDVVEYSAPAGVQTLEVLSVEPADI